MGTATQLVFRPSAHQRILAALLCVGSWLVGIRALALLFEQLPRWLTLIRFAQSAGEPTSLMWISLGGAVLACVLGGIILALVLLSFVLIEGCQVLVDDLGMTVEYTTLPSPLAKWAGAGRLGWKQILHLDKRAWSFVVRGNPDLQDGTHPILHPTLSLRFMLVHELERLVLLILERSPNLK